MIIANLTKIKEFNLVLSKPEINQIYDKVGKEPVKNRSMFVKYSSTGNILEAYEFTGYFPALTTELRKIF